MSESYITHIRQVRSENGTSMWEAWHPRLPGCRAQGETPEAAQDALDECRQTYLQALADCEQPIPLGDTTISRRVVIHVHESVVRG